VLHPEPRGPVDAELERLGDARPEELKRVDEYRSFARELSVAVRAGRKPPSGPRGWPVAVVDLAERIRDGEHEPVRGWAEAACWEELRALYCDDPERAFPQAPPPPYVFPLRRLSAEGHETCPTCRRPIPTPKDFRRWDRLEREAAKRRDTREGAIP
jgi:hypothetical protein